MELAETAEGEIISLSGVPDFFDVVRFRSCVEGAHAACEGRISTADTYVVCTCPCHKET